MKPIAKTDGATARPHNAPYTLAQIMANLETMRDVTDLGWCQQFAASAIERGIDAMPTSFGTTDHRERAALLTVAEAARNLVKVGDVPSLVSLADSLEALAQLREVQNGGGK